MNSNTPYHLSDSMQSLVMLLEARQEVFDWAVEVAEEESATGHAWFEEADDEVCPF